MSMRWGTCCTVECCCNDKAHDQRSQCQGKPIEECNDKNKCSENHSERHQKHSVGIRQKVVHRINIFRKPINYPSQRSRIKKRHWRSHNPMNSLPLLPLPNRETKQKERRYLHV